MPTRKWLAARVTAIAGLVILAISTDQWNKEEWIALVTIVSEAIASYLVPNQSTATGDGVPGKAPASP